MARASKTDPLRNFKFQVTIVPGGDLLRTQARNLGNLGFSVVSGISVQNELIAYREGGMNTHPHKLLGQSDYGPVTFSKGVFAHEKDLYLWQTFLHSWSQGAVTGSGEATGSTATNNDYRCDLTVVVFDHPVSSGAYQTPGDTNSTLTPAGNAKMGFKLFNCWPASYALTDLNAGDSSIMIQQMVLNHEGFHVEWAASPDGHIDPTALAAVS